MMLQAKGPGLQTSPTPALPAAVGDAVGDPEVGAAGEDAFAQGGIAGDSGDSEVALGVFDRFAGELIVPGQALSVGVDGALGDTASQARTRRRRCAEPRFRAGRPDRGRGRRRSRARSRSPRAGIRGHSGWYRSRGRKMSELDLHGRPVHGVGLSTASNAACSAPAGDPPNPRPTTSVNGESEPANVAAPPPIGRTNRAVPERACAARLAATINSVSAASMRDANAASQNSDDRWPTAFLPVFSRRLR